MKIFVLGLLARCGNLVLQTLHERQAVIADRTLIASWLGGRANFTTEFHQRLVEVAAALARQNRFRELPQHFLIGR